MRENYVKIKLIYPNDFEKKHLVSPELVKNKRKSFQMPFTLIFYHTKT